MSLLKISFVSLLAFVISQPLEAQVSTENEKHWVLEPTVSFGPTNEVTLGLGRVEHIPLYDISIGYSGPTISGGIGFYQGERPLVAKLGYSWISGIFAVRMSAVGYTNFTNHSPALRPEVGLSWLGLLTVTYGYSFAPSAADYYSIQGSLVSVNIGLSSFYLR